MTHVHRCDCAEPAVACVCHLRDPLRLVLDPSVAVDDPLRVGVEVLCDPTDPDVEKSFARVKARLRSPVLAVAQADEWAVAGTEQRDDATEREHHRRESFVRPIRRDGAT